MELTNFYVIADTHYFAKSLGCYGKEYNKFMRYEQKCFAETQAINESVFEFLQKTKDTDNILIAGDLTFNGEKESHLGFLKLLKKLKDSGKNIYVITADHDCKEKPFSFDKYGKHTPQNTKREELFDLYYEYGFKDAIAVDKEHLSYVAQIAPSVRLLALNGDGDCKKHRTYNESQIKWIKEQCQKAKEDNQMIFAMNHYPLLPGQPILGLINSAVQENADEITTMLANNGVNLVFTGHMHNQSINKKVTPSGNMFYDVCTGSIIAAPSYIRKVTVLNKSQVRIESLPTPDFNWDTGKLTCKEYLSHQFDSMILNLINDMKTNPKALMHKIGIKDDEKLYPIFMSIGKRIDTITVGKTCKALMIKCDKSIKDMLLKNYITELVRQVFAGNQNFIKGTAKGDVFVSLLNRYKPLINKIDVKDRNKNKVDLYDVLINSAGNYGIDDNNAVLDLKY